MRKGYVGGGTDTGPHRNFKHYTDSGQDLRTHKTYLFRLTSHRNLHLKTFSWYLWRFDEHRRLKLVFLLPFHRWGRAGPFHHKRLPLWSWGVATSAFWLMFTLTIFSRFSSLPFFLPSLMINLGKWICMLLSRTKTFLKFEKQIGEDCGRKDYWINKWNERYSSIK